MLDNIIRTDKIHVGFTIGCEGDMSMKYCNEVVNTKKERTMKPKIEGINITLK